MISIDRWTDNAKLILQSMLQSAQSAGHSELVPSHLLQALLNEGMARAILQKEGADPDRLAGELSVALGRLPRVEGATQQPITSSALAAVFSAAQNRASKSGHQYVTAAHLLWATFDKPDKPSATLSLRSELTPVVFATVLMKCSTAKEPVKRVPKTA